jgi:predicted RNA polymerase sigma factor
MDALLAGLANRAVIDARLSYGRLLALLASRSGDLAGAEDALAEAFVAALETWSIKGVPDKPEAWLMAVAKNKQLDVWRSAAFQTSQEYVEEEIESMLTTEFDPDSIPDERLKLLFVCAHPAIDQALRAPLMLQTVLGIEAKAIADAFLIPATALAQRLVRVKKKIKEAGIPFVSPSQSDMPTRLEFVLEAIYGAYSIGWSDTDLSIADDNNMCEEARYLANLLAQLLPQEPEVLGLASFISLSSARRAARRGVDDEFIPLDEQDTRLWDLQRIQWGEGLLAQAQTYRVLGRFQIEAAIESVHCSRLKTASINWDALALLYEGLIQYSPSAGALVARAVAIGHAQNPNAGLAALGETSGYQPALVARAHLFFLAKEKIMAVAALDAAIAITEQTPVRNFLVKRRQTYLTT